MVCIFTYENPKAFLDEEFLLKMFYHQNENK